MITPPIPANESSRLATLRTYNVLDTLPEQEFDDLTRLAAAICRTPIALVSLVDENRQWFKSRVGLDAPETPRDVAFCAHAILDAKTMIVADADRDERFHDNPLVTGHPRVRFYAGAPLVVPTGERLGTLCVIDHEPRSLSLEQIAALETLARHVASQLESRRRIAELARMQEASATPPADLARHDRFRILSDAAPIGIYETDANGKCLYTNPAWQKIAGLTFQESLGDGWTIALHPDDQALVFEEWRRAVEEKREFALEFRFRSPAGGVRDVESHARAIVGPAGNIEGYVGTVRDVTVRRSAQVALRESQQQLARVLEGSTDGFWDWNVTTGEIQFSQRLTQMLGYEPDEIEPLVDHWRALIHPEDASAAAGVLNSHLQGLTAHYESEHRVRTKGGAWKWILDRGKVTERDAAGLPLRMAGTHTDIDERKRAEELLERFFSVSLDLLCIAGMDGRFRRVNPAFEEVLGYPTGELVSRPFLDFVHPDDRERTVRELENLATGKTTFRFENRYIHRDGTERWISWTATPHPEEGLIYAAGRDVTRETFVLHALAESEDRYRDLFENATDMIQSVDASGRLLYANATWLSTLGYAPSEIEGLNVLEVIAPESREHCRDMMARVMTGETIPKIVTCFQTRTGERRVVEGSVSCRFEQGRPVSTRGIFRDITEQKKAEEEVRARESAMRSMIGSSLSGIVTFDQNGLIESLNPAAERILGYTSRDLTGSSVAVLLAQPPADFEQFQRRAVDDALGRITEWEIVRGDGRVAQIELALFEFETVRGKQLAGNIQDVSQRREIERMKREFVSTISHELRTPLTSIRGSLDLLQGDVLGTLAPPAREVVSIAHRNTTRLIGLINDILDLDRLDNGKLELQFEPTDVDLLFRTAIDSVRAFAEQNGVGIERSLSDAVVMADAHRMTQVLVNLLSNAVKFSPPGSVVGLAAVEEGDQVVIRVSDRGRGIAPEHQGRIFDRFQQIEASDSRSKGGSGLGLAISRAIVEQHRGTIGVTSEPGVGSTFYVRLSSARGRNGTAPTAERPIGAYVHSMAIATTLEAALRDEGQPVVTFATPEQAESAFRSGNLAMLIIELDCGPAGTTLLSRIRQAETRSETPLVVLACASDSIEWFDDNLTVLLSKSDGAALLDAIRRFARDSRVSDVLLIEDDAALQEVLRRQLESEGIRVRTASTGGSAIAMIRKAPPKLIVLDVGLPDIDGFDVVSVLRRDAALRRLPLLVYTGRYLDSEERDRLRLGPTRFLTKTSEADFRGIVAELIRSVAEART